MDNDQQKQVVTGIVRSQLQQKAYLYSYIFMIIIALANILLSGVGMIVDLEKGLDYVWYYLAIGFGLASLLFIVWLSTLYFVGGDEKPSAGRIKAVGIMKILVRAANLLTGTWFLTLSFVYQSAQSKGWNGFLRGYGIVIMILEGVMVIYSLWKNAWIRENPERYMTPVYPVVPGDSSEVAPHQESAAQPATPKSAKAEPKAIAASPEPQLIEVHETKKSRKKSTK